MPDTQVICDAKAETATLVDLLAPKHLFASQVNPATMEAVGRPMLWHLGTDIEDYFPEHKRKAGGYCLIGGGAAVGNSALCVAYAMGFRELHVFGLDSSNGPTGETHAYDQPMNRVIPSCVVEFAGRQFISSVAMKAQAEKFQITGQQLKRLGCDIRVYGDGLLQHMWTAPPEHLTERDKYRLMWQFDSYRAVAPGELLVDMFLRLAEPQGTVIDFGCGTGRAGMLLAKAGLDVLLIDFASNCRDHEALGLPFIEWDLTRPCPARAPYGYCTDVMEHIPPDDVATVLKNIFEATPSVFFSIGTEPDQCGALIQQTLHMSVRPHEEWRTLLATFGEVCFEDKGEGQSLFYVERHPE